MGKRERIEALKSSGFNYAALYLEDPIIFENLTVNDLAALWLIGNWESEIYRKGITVRGRHFSGKKLEELVLKTVPRSLHSHFQKNNITQQPSAEEIFIIDDVYRGQGDIRDDFYRAHFSQRFDESALATLDARNRHSAGRNFVNTHGFVNLMAGVYLFTPLPQKVKARLFLKDVVDAVAQQKQTPKLERYVQDVLRKSLVLHNALETQYLVVRTSPEYSEGGTLDEQNRIVRQLQEKVSFNLQGYTPIKPYDNVIIWQMYGQVIKDGVLDIRQVAYGFMPPDTEFGRWITKRFEELKREIPPVRAN